MRRAALLLAVCSLLLLAACGGETTTPSPDTVVGTLPTETTPEGDPAAGKQVFATAGCGSCHTLADAGTNATIGPDLDEAKPDLELVIDRVTNGKGVMPSFAGQLSEQQIADVSAYVVQATSG